MIRHATFNDLPEIARIYAAAKRFMAASGNPNQWNTVYPDELTLTEDIEASRLYVCEIEGALRGVFAFILGEDPTYAYIENGAWPNALPYGTIHRIASDGQTKGIFAQCFHFALSQIDQIRIDTHQDNKPMQHVLAKHGFRRCGIIYIETGDPRIAYQYSKQDEGIDP